MDRPIEERPGVEMLGEFNISYVRRAIYGGRGDLRCRGFYKIPGRIASNGKWRNPSCKNNRCLQEDIICVWNKSASDVATTTRIRDTLKRVLHLPASASMEYKTHNDSLKNLMRL